MCVQINNNSSSAHHPAACRIFNVFVQCALYLFQCSTHNNGGTGGQRSGSGPSAAWRSEEQTWDYIVSGLKMFSGWYGWQTTFHLQIISVSWSGPSWTEPLCVTAHAHCMLLEMRIEAPSSNLFIVNIMHFNNIRQVHLKNVKDSLEGPKRQTWQPLKTTLSQIYQTVTLVLGKV